jgi:hypothetical protein
VDVSTPFELCAGVRSGKRCFARLAILGDPVLVGRELVIRRLTEAVADSPA